MGEIRRVLRPGSRCAYATWGPPDRNPWIFQIVMALVQNGYAPSGDPFAPGGVFSLATPERNNELAAAAGFTNITVEELTGTMRFGRGQTSVMPQVPAIARGSSLTPGESAQVDRRRRSAACFSRAHESALRVS